MDRDDRLSLADHFSESNSEGDDIDSELEDKLYAAVFHSNDISSKSQDISGYNNFTSLTDVIGSWKNIPDASDGPLARNKSNDAPCPSQDFNTNLTGINKSKECVAADSESFQNVSNCNEREKNHATDVSGYGDRLEESYAPESRGNAKSCNTVADKQLTIDLYGSRELICESETVQRKDTSENVSGKEKLSPRTEIIKRQKSSPKKLANYKDSSALNSTLTSSKSDMIYEADTRAAINLRDNLAITSAPKDPNESSDIKAEEALGNNQLIEKERRSSLFGEPVCIIDEGLDEPSSFKSEEQLKKLQSAQREAVDKEFEDRANVKPEEELGRINSVEKESLLSSRDSSSSDSSLADLSYSAVQDTRDIRARLELDTTKSMRNDDSVIIILDDSEDSIFEIPVPPKPSPPTIDLDDSQSSDSSDSDNTSSAMSPKKLVEDYKIAISESSSKNRSPKGKAESTVLSKTGQQRQTVVSSNRSTSDSDDSMTENEEENWGIIAGNQIDIDKQTQNSSKDVRVSEIIDNLTTGVERENNSRQIIEDRDRSVDIVSEQLDKSIRESQREPLLGNSESTKRVSGDRVSISSLVVEEDSGNAGKVSQTGQMMLENSEMEISPDNEQNLTENNTIIINAESVRNLEDSGALETPSRMSENRKRSITDSGKKSKHQNSPKKAKTFDDVAASSSPSVKPRKENNENKGKQRNCAADYFFKPMNSEMQNYYNKSWGGENFDIDVLRREMPRDPRHWAILSEDSHGYQQRRSRYWTESKCRNCHHTGHNMAECPEKRKVPSCHMCGVQGHREPRCPHKMCLGCGKKQKTYMQVCNGCRRAWCNGCKSYGHVEDNCPDLWRRYHLTTSFRDVNTQLDALDVMKPQHLLSCCNCAKQGHDSTTCNNYRWSRHFPTPSFVTNYTSGPAYSQHLILEDVDSPSEARDEIEATEKRNTNADIQRTSLTNNEGKKRKSNVDIVTSENPDVVEFVDPEPKDVDKSVEKTNEPTKNPTKSNQEKSQKRSSEVLPQNSDIPKNAEILLSMKSQLLDTRFTQAVNFGECTIALSAKHYDSLANSDLSQKFLLNLTSQFPMKFEIKRYGNGALEMSISSTRDLHFPLQVTILDWLKWPLDERSRFVSLNLPTTKEELIKLLSSKLEELKLDLGDPILLYETIKKLKSDLQRLQRQSKSGKKTATCSKRARIVEELAKSQCKVNMILLGRSKVKKWAKSCKFLRNALSEMVKPDSTSYISAALYLQIVHHYNTIFSAYTPNNLQSLLDGYRHKRRVEDERNTHPTPKKKRLANCIADRTRMKSHNVANNSRDVIPVSSTGSNVSLNSSDQLLSENLNIHKGDSGLVINAGVNCYGVESQFQIPQAGFNDKNLNSNSRPPQFPEIIKRNQHDFGNNSNLQRRERGLLNAERNYQQHDYVASENRNLQNNYYTETQYFECNATGYFSRKTRRRRQDKSNTRNSLREWMDTEAANTPRANVQRNFSHDRNRWQDSKDQRNITSQDMFYSDTQANSSQNFHPNDRLDILSRNEAKGRVVDDVNAPSTSGTPNQLQITVNNNTGSVPEKAKSGNNKNKKKKKNKGTKLPSYLQKRAAKNIAKYMDVELPCITQAAIELQKKLSNDGLTLQCVRKFEMLIKRKLKKTDHLL